MRQTKGVTEPEVEAPSADMSAAEANDSSAVADVAPWLQATIADLGNWDFEAPIAGSLSAASYELSQKYLHAAKHS